MTSYFQALTLVVFSCPCKYKITFCVCSNSLDTSVEIKFPLPSKMENGTIVFVLLLVSLVLGTTTSVTTSYNVMEYEAIGDGTTDDSQAFIKAWNSACKSYSGPVSVLIVPERTFMLKPSTFNGPCNPSHINVQVFGKIVAPNNKSAWIGYHINTWLAFSNVNGLIISGQGQIDGQGSVWWPQPCLHDIPKGAKCNGPTALTFKRCNGLQLNGMTHTNSPRNHITLTKCKGVVISNLYISAPQTSPNTDGIRISASNNVVIRNCIIGTGDDCVAISGGSSNISITGVRCGPGHGISIGALGHGGYDTVEEIHVQNCTFEETLNGVRIKSWQGGDGYVRKISFQKIKLLGVNNPIIIDQFYCPRRVNCQNKTTAVQVSDVSYSTIFGTSASEDAINLSCNQASGCTNISLDYVYIYHLQDQEEQPMPNASMPMGDLAILSLLPSA